MPPEIATVRLLSVLLIVTAATAANGQEPVPSVASIAPTLDEVTIIGHRRDPADVPGSVHVIDQEDLRTYLQSDVMRVLRSVPGVYLQDEDGFGLRPNIGIRGSGLDRSARVAILEDGVLITPAPYAAPAAYYFPTQRRMYGIEVLKGPSSVAIGPKTTGGAINLISTPIPDTFAVYADLRAGQNNALDAHLNVGNRGQRFSWLVETVQAKNGGFKIIDGPADRDTGFNIQDYLVKVQFDSDTASTLYQSLRLKAGYTNQVSEETYLGLLEDDFRQNPNRRYAATAGDVFNGEHEQFQVSYVVDADSNWRGEITAYRNNFARDWFRVQSVNGVDLNSVLDDTTLYAREFGYLTGNTSPDDAVMKRHNDRGYISQGVQAKLSWNGFVGESEIALTAGLRMHEDKEDRLQSEDGFRMENLALFLTSVGAPGSNSNRLSTAKAASFFVDTEIRSGKWIFTPGARFEDIKMQRLDFSSADPDRSQGPTNVRTNSLSVVIPGIGALYEWNDTWRFFGGLHKGFNPPAPGSGAAVESSLNLEAGTRFDNGTAQFEAIYFLNEYKNLVGTVTASTGGSGTIGDQFDGGDVTVAGIEFSAAFATEIGDLTLPFDIQYTWTKKAQFNNSFDSGFNPWGEVETGDELPYIPEHQLRASVGLQTDRWGANLAASYVGQMRTVAGQGAIKETQGVDARVIWDAIGRWNWSDSWSTYVKVDNLFDEVYIVSRRPAGVRPGLERTAYVGLTFTL